MSDRWARLRVRTSKKPWLSDTRQVEEVRALLAERDELRVAVRALLDRFDFGEDFPPDHPIVFARSALSRAGKQEDPDHG